LINPITLCDKYRSWSPSLCRLLHFLITSSFCTPLLPRPSYAQISFSAPYSWKPSACVIPSIWQTKFHTHTKNRKIYGNLLIRCLSSVPERSMYEEIVRHYVRFRAAPVFDYILHSTVCGWAKPLNFIWIIRSMGK
jgi:hypothetical protein